MLTVRSGSSVSPLAILEVWYPQRSHWRESVFYAMVDEHLECLREKHAAYDRKAVFGDNPYYRYFKKFKKTYPVMMQFESFLLKGRPFPRVNPITDIPFLAELETHALLGVHDMDRVQGRVEFFSGTEKTPFMGMRGEEVHTYPGDLCARDEAGIILSMIAGVDYRTFVREDSLHVFYPVFGTPGQPVEEIRALLELLSGYVDVLAPEAEKQVQLI